jgi:hypothetical protein
MELLNRGRKKLIFAETKMNRQSSRSHAICFITTECIVATEGGGTVFVWGQKCVFEDAITSHDCWLEASIRAIQQYAARAPTSVLPYCPTPCGNTERQ